MKLNVPLLGAIVAGLFVAQVDAQEGRMFRERYKEKLQQVADLRAAVQQFFEAKSSGDRDAALKAAARAREVWQGIPEGMRSRIETNHPGTGERLTGLAQEFDQPDTDTPAQTSSSPTGTAPASGADQKTTDSETARPWSSLIMRMD